jgi:hypothetical protein
MASFMAAMNGWSFCNIERRAPDPAVQKVLGEPLLLGCSDL